MLQIHPVHLLRQDHLVVVKIVDFYQTRKNPEGLNASAKMPYLPILLADRRLLKENLNASARMSDHLVEMKIVDFYKTGKNPEYLNTNARVS